MNPQLTIGNFDQRLWPGAGDIDDCFVVASLVAVATVAPWLYLHTVTSFRAAAGNPDEKGVLDGGTIPQVAKALKTLYPSLAIDVSNGDITWTAFLLKVKAGHPAMVFIQSEGLKDAFEYGWKGGHAVAVAYIDGALKLANPLAPAHSRWRTIGANELEAAVKGWPGLGVSCVFMPTPDEAFKAHPALSGAIAKANAATIAENVALAAKLSAANTTVVTLQATVDADKQALADMTASRDLAMANASAALSHAADLQAALDTANQALAESRLSLGKWDALRRLFRELLGLSN